MAHSFRDSLRDHAMARFNALINAEFKLRHYLKLRRGAPVSDGKPGVSWMRAIEFAAPPMAKRHKTNFTRKDSLPQQAYGEQKRSAVPASVSMQTASQTSARFALPTPRSLAT
jgi:hypothetical protein